jgi:predicted Zn-dependent protease
VRLDIYRLCFGVGLVILFGGWVLALVTSLRLDGSPPSLWLHEDREIEESRRRGELAQASEDARIRGTLLADPALLRDAANLALSAKSPELGVEALRRLVALEPGNPKARFQLAAALMQLGRKRDAADELKALLRIAPGHQRAREALERIEKRLEAPI